MSRPHSAAPRVIIASRLFTPEVAAAAFRLQALAEGLIDEAAEVRVLTTRPRGMTASARPGISVSRFPVLRDRQGSVRGYLQYLSFDIPLFFRLLFARGDVVVSEPPPTTGGAVMLASWLRRRPFVYYAADIWSDAAASTKAPALVVKLLRALEGAVMRRATVVLAVSEEIAQRVRELGGSRVVPVGNGIDSEVFTPDGPRAPAEVPCFVYAGTMSEWQGVQIFIEAFSKIIHDDPQAQLHLFGQGSALAELRGIAARTAPEHIHFHGVIPPAETASWLRAATAALVSIRPGLGYDFAKPTKLYAAAACGTPVIFAGSGAGRAVVADGELGMAVDYSAEEVAFAMRELLEEHRSGRTARLRAARAEWAGENASLQAVGRRAASAVLAAPR